MPKANKRKIEADKNVNNKRLKTGNSAQETSSKPEKGINDLPNEMLLNIFSYLGQKDILNATLVKKKWNNLISHTDKTMKKIQTVYVNTDNMMCGIPKFTRPYTKVEVQNVKLECDINLLNRLVKIGKGIKSVVFDHCWFLGNAMTSFLKCFKNLKDLHITHCEITKVPVHRKIILKELEMLHLDIYSWPLAYIEAPNLTKFQCHTMLIEDQNFIMTFLNQQTKLENLDFNCCYNLFHATQNHLDPKFKLKELKFNDMMEYNRVQMMNLLSSMTDSLTSLEIGIDMGHDITNFAFKNFINLESLTIDCDSLPSSPSFYNDIKTSQTLKTVEIGGELEKTMAVLQFLEHHPEIESLDLSALFNIPSTRYSFWSRLAAVTEKVRTLKLDTLDADNIRYIKSKNLKEFKIYSLEFIDNHDWIEFCRNNPNIERFYAYGTDESFNINDVKSVLTQNLPKLKEFSVDYSPAE